MRETEEEILQAMLRAIGSESGEASTWYETRLRPFANRLVDAERDADMYRAWHVRWAHELHDIAGVYRYDEPVPANAVDASIALVMGVTSKLRAERDALQRDVDQLRTGEFVPRGETDPERLERLERAVRQLAAYSKERPYIAPNDWAGAVGEISRELAKREGRPVNRPAHCHD